MWKRMLTRPAEEFQVDWSPYRVLLGGVLTLVHAFGMALAFSRKVPGLQMLQLGHREYSVICYNLLLPVLLFEAALNLKWELFARNARPIFGLAVLGTIANIGVVGLLVHFLLDVPWLQALQAERPSP